MSERIEWRILNIAVARDVQALLWRLRVISIIRPSGVFLKVIERYLSYASRKRNRKLPRRIVITEKNIRDCIPAFRTESPRFQYGRDVFMYPVQFQRTSVHKCHNDRFTCFVHSLKEFLLYAG